MRFTNLFVGYNAKEHFRILICAFDDIEAMALAEEYRLDAKLEGKFEVYQLDDDIDKLHFDCDYVIA